MYTILWYCIFSVHICVIILLRFFLTTGNPLVSLAAKYKTTTINYNPLQATILQSLVGVSFECHLPQSHCSVTAH